MQDEEVEEEEEAKPNCYLQDEEAEAEQVDADEEVALEEQAQEYGDDEEMLGEIIEGMQVGSAEVEFEEMQVEDTAEVEFEGVKVEDIKVEDDASGELIEETEKLLEDAEDLLEADRVSECSDDDTADAPWRQRKFRPGDGYHAVRGYKFPPPPRDEDAPPVSMASRTADERRKFREQNEQASQWGNLDEETKWAGENQVPWDLRGPLRGPKEGGPQLWKGQRFRENKQVWANNGGQNKTRYSLYFKMMGKGVTGTELRWYHPLNQKGKYAGDVIEPLAA